LFNVIAHPGLDPGIVPADHPPAEKIDVRVKGGSTSLRQILKARLPWWPWSLKPVHRISMRWF